MMEVQAGEQVGATGLPPQQAMVDKLWAWLKEIPDPEIPVISLVDLGIVRGAAWNERDGSACITITPTYSGCPATDVIGGQIRDHLCSHGVERMQLKVQLSPAWTTDWMTEEGKQNLKEYGIAPPAQRAAAHGNGMAASLVVLGQGPPKLSLGCPRCGSKHTELLSPFGSTPCKSLHRCLECLEPFDHFKCH